MSGTFRSPWKRSHSAGDRSRDLSLQSESPPTPFHTSGVSLVGVGEQEPHLYLPCVPAELSAALQVPSEVGTAVGSLGPWTEISSLDCLFLGKGKIANSFCSAVSWASQQPTPCRQRLPSPAESWGGQGRWADNSHSPGPSWTRYLGPRSFAFHFVWINFTLPPDSHFLSRLQIPEPEGPSREECRLIPLTCLLLRVRAGKIHIFRLHLYPSIYIYILTCHCASLYKIVT